MIPLLDRMTLSRGRHTLGGFTLIELIIVILLLSILSVTALPRFVDLQDEARTAAVAGIVGAINSSAAINYGTYQLSPGRATALSGTATACADLIAGNAGLVGLSLPTTVQIASEGTCGASALSAGVTTTCVIQDKVKNYISATAYVICTG